MKQIFQDTLRKNAEILDISPPILQKMNRTKYSLRNFRSNYPFRKTNPSIWGVDIKWNGSVLHIIIGMMIIRMHAHILGVKIIGTLELFLGCFIDRNGSR